ncbi:peptidase S8 and S53 subtilisin kexin sedolisin [[Leptolyngbya] sp. PCC 7376]|uniref:S8 family serine peptidase n=1 Tax=[Leptolyngbya] sp. PCC 7376 TaxID=111781 RepID=UPI00029F0B51|nr:S8 family serine peptidase [[Leptolyngbya] sp. PCC 7376]AFY40177.1 peptidase S8 and S53 subtilisin kexin sedolisin [[Leptolyngbya] sp. PCC 7376]
MQGFGQQRSLFGLFTCSCAVLGSFNGAIAESLHPSIGELGIQATTLHAEPYDLLGRKIAIGQVEIGRPGKFGLDKRAAWQPQLNLPQLFFVDGKAIPDENVDDHAGMVAGVMISRDKRQLGVAPAAKLFASAIGSLDESGQPQECLATQHVALQNSQDVRAINFSFGESLARDDRSNPILDGNSLFTQCLDWSARVYDVLHVVAGNQGSGGIPIPTDQYNGITTAYTTRFKGDEFNKVDFANLSSLPEGIGSSLIREEINYGDRRAISLTAPGSRLELITTFNKIKKVSGTSFAAPHITGTVALLQEYGDRQITNKVENWSLDSRRHEVIKAVLLNSAEKVEDQGDGKLLGMERTILKENNLTWFDSDAATNSEIPLDIQMGTGQLNARRSHEQFAGGQWSPTTTVANIGWNYDELPHQNYHDYLIDAPLIADSYVSATTTWDRRVELNDLNQNERYDEGETFQDLGLNNLDLYLLPATSDNLKDAICHSNSSVDSVEHLFCPVPNTAQYKLRVVFPDKVNEDTQNYAIAWWSAAQNPSLAIETPN